MSARPRFDIRVRPAERDKYPAAHITYAGQHLASIYPTHAAGPGLQVASARLSFLGGMMGDPNDGVSAFSVLRLFAVQQHAGPMPWVAFVVPQPGEGSGGIADATGSSPIRRR